MNSVWAIVSTFRPDHSTVAAVESILPQVAGVVVVDDASGEAAQPILTLLAETGAIVEVLDANSGIAAALNRGYEIVLARGAEGVVSFDQDSSVTPGFVGSLVAEQAAATARGQRVGSVVPEYFADVRQVSTSAKDGTFLARNIIQSGMLVSAEVLSQVGLLRTDFFIDLVDTEYELRLRSMGFAVIAAPGTRLGHQLGQQYQRMLFGRPLRVPGLPSVTTFSAPFRYYYRVRNRIVLNRMYWRKAPGQILRDSAIDALHIVNAALVARPRRSFFRIVRGGVRAGARRRMGRMPQGLASLATTVRWNAPLVSSTGVRGKGEDVSA